MANTYTQIYIHLVFAVKRRQHLIERTWKDELYKFITGIVENNGHKMLRINGMPDHIHILIGYCPSQTIPSLVEIIKTDSNHFVKRKKFCPGKFSWQRGYGDFSYNRSQLDTVVNYIINQEEHHRRKTFRKEYVELLEKFDVDYNERFLFDD